MNHFIRNLLSIGWLLLFVLSLTVSPALAQPPVNVPSAQIQSIYQTDISGPQGSTSFGSQVTVLPNGNFVVIDPNYSTDTAAFTGAAYLYDGDTLALISMLTGTATYDYVGYNGIVVLSDGNFVVISPNWNEYTGAVTWVDGTTGLSGVVSASNSLIGSAPGDLAGQGGVLALENGDYLVSNITWDGLGLDDYTWYGAVTWVGSPASRTGVVSADNSLIGGEEKSLVGTKMVLLSNGNFLVWGFHGTKGSVTWGSAVSGLPTGPVTSSNSLVGSTYEDNVGRVPGGFFEALIPLSNGNYLVASPVWDSGGIEDAGAVTWGNGSSGTTGVVSSANSLVGSHPFDAVGSGANIPGVTALSNGNYVVISPWWDNGTTANAGAVTWGNGSSGTKGVVSIANSLVSTQAESYVGFEGVTALTNGNYVVNSPRWDSASASQAGAVTWGNGASGVKGAISSANSLVGEFANDQLGWGGVKALPSGNYVVSSPYWNQNRGAITWSNGASGIKGNVSSANSLIGATINDFIGLQNTLYPKLGLTILSNGNYVVSSPYWQRSWGESGFGAVTWGNGTTGITGEVSEANSLVGSSASDKVGMMREYDYINYIDPLDGVIPLSNGDFVVASAYWDNGAAADAGAVTWVDGDTGLAGVVSSANSLVGSSTDDRIGMPYGDQELPGVTALSNGNYVVTSPYWDNGAEVDAGAATWGSGELSGAISSANSLVGSSNDRVGSDGAAALANGSYVVRSRYWNNPSAGKVEVGAATWGSGSSGVSGAVSAANSLIGSTDFDGVGSGALLPLDSGDFLLHSPAWDNGAAFDSGAVTWGSGLSGTIGEISSSNSVLGSYDTQGATLTFLSAENDQRILVGRDLDQIVSILELAPRLVVLREGDGAGTVSSNPAGIDCGDDCSEPYTPGTQVTLTALAAQGSTFSGWSGACSGTGDCVVSMDDARTVTAAFSADTHILTVSMDGDGVGAVSSDPAGIACGDDCTEPFDSGTIVTLTAAPEAGSSFAGWSGACSGTGDCTVTMDQAWSVTASFTADPIYSFLLTVSLAGDGSGTVSSNPAGIACGVDCSESYTQDTLVTLTAIPGQSSTFSGWSGPCSGMGDCVVTMSAAMNVTATFSFQIDLPQTQTFLPMVTKT